MGRARRAERVESKTTRNSRWGTTYRVWDDGVKGRLSESGGVGWRGGGGGGGYGTFWLGPNLCQKIRFVTPGQDKNKRASALVKKDVGGGITSGERSHGIGTSVASPERT